MPLPKIGPLHLAKKILVSIVYKYTQEPPQAQFPITISLGRYDKDPSVQKHEIIPLRTDFDIKDLFTITELYLKHYLYQHMTTLQQLFQDLNGTQLLINAPSPTTINAPLPKITIEVTNHHTKDLNVSILSTRNFPWWTGVDQTINIANVPKIKIIPGKAEYITFDPNQRVALWYWLIS
ncbi:MAG: hypothetical protein ACXACH_07510 [Candidatus Hermodarchaeia archaeon]|jgi:hypothetical protein